MGLFDFKEEKPKFQKPLTRDITEVFGKTGYGKSQFTKRRIKTEKRVIIVDPQGEYYGVQEFSNLDALVDHVSNYKVFRVRHCDLRDFDDLCMIAASIPNVLMVVDEAQRIIPPRGELPEHFENLIYRGRHSGTSIHLVAQRPTTVDIAVRSQWNRLITFNQSETRDIKWIEETSGYDVESEIRNLKVLEYLEITNDGFEKKKLQGFVK